MTNSIVDVTPFDFTGLSNSFDFRENMHNGMYQLEDGSIGSTKAADFVDASVAEEGLQESGFTVVPKSPKDVLGEHSARGLVEALEFYGLNKGTLKSVEEIEEEFKNGVTGHLLAFIKLKQGDSLDRVLGQTGVYAGDAAIVQAAYDTTGTVAFALLEQIKAGSITVEDAINQLPALSWE